MYGISNDDQTDKGDHCSNSGRIRYGTYIYNLWGGQKTTISSKATHLLIS